MTKASKRTMNEIYDIVLTTAAKYPCLNRIGVFGSYARGDYDETSDIDILYDYDPNPYDSTDQLLDFVDDFLERVSPLKADFVSFARLIEKEDDFKKNAMEDVIWIYGTRGGMPVWTADGISRHVL